MASKLPPQDLDKEELIAATTLFSLTGAEDTRKELQDTLLGKKLGYLLMMTEESRFGITPYMVVCPVEDLGYIACVSNKREDMAILIMNMKRAAVKIADVLIPHKDFKENFEISPIIEKVQTIQDTPPEDTRYNKILNKIKNLRNIKVSSFIPPSGLQKEAPIVGGNPGIPRQIDTPQEITPQSKFKSIPVPPESSETPLDKSNAIYPQTQNSNVQYSQISNNPYEQSSLPQQKQIGPVFKPPGHMIKGFKKFRIKFQNEKQIIFTMIISALTVEDAIRLCQEKNPQFKIVKIIEVYEIN